MGPLPVNLVVEDQLSESVCRRILAHSSLEPGIVYGKEGFGYLKTRLQGFNNAAKGTRYLVLADLDQFHCAAGLWNHWLPNIKRHPNLLFRVAVREVESWLLADCENLNAFFGLKRRDPIPHSDQLSDPKREILTLALKSPRRKLREAVVFQNRNGGLLQGPDYNGTLIGFVENRWDLSTAVHRSDSLNRAVKAVGLSGSS